MHTAFRQSTRGLGRRARRTLQTVGLTLIVSAAGLACSQHQDLMDPGNTMGQVVTIDLTNFAFSQSSVTIAPGTTIRWRNTTSSFHTVTPDGHAAWTEWQTNTNGETFDVQFNETGTFPYYCQPHRSLGMTGTIVVQ